MIGPAGAVELPVTSTSGYRERQQWGGREDASTSLFGQWLNASFHAFTDLVDTRGLDVG